MKKLFYLFTISVIAISVFTSCGSDDNGGASSSSGSFYFKYTVDGQTKQFPMSPTTFFTESATGGFQQYLLGSINGNTGEGVMITFDTYENGTYDFNAESVSVITYFTEDKEYRTDIDCDESHGQLTISYSSNDIIEGTFTIEGEMDNFEDQICGEDHKTVTGSFRLKLNQY